MEIRIWYIAQVLDAPLSMEKISNTSCFVGSEQQNPYPICLLSAVMDKGDICVELKSWRGVCACMPRF